MQRRLVATVLVAGSFALTACGSTISASRLGGSAQQAALGGDGLSLTPTTPGEVTPTTGTDLAGGGSVGGDAGTPSESASPGTDGGFDEGAGSSAGSGSVAGGARFGPGVTAKTITVGIVYTPGAAEANSAAGANGISQGDEKANFTAIAANVNAHGGLGGRKLQYVFYALPASTTKPYAQIDQELCAFFSQDHKVFAVNLDGISSTGSFAACMEKAGTIMIDTGKPSGPTRSR